MKRPPRHRRLVSTILPLLIFVGLIARAESALFEDHLNDLGQWTALNGSPPSIASNTFHGTPFMQLGNGVARASLSKAVSGNWTLGFKARHSDYSRQLQIGVFDDTGTQGYGVLWDSSLQTYANGQGYVSIRKYALATEPTFPIPGAALSSVMPSGRAATTGDMSAFELSWDEASHTLILRVDGVEKGRVVDSTYNNFSRIYVAGNTYSYFDDIVLSDRLVFEDRMESTSNWTKLYGSDPSVATSGTTLPVPYLQMSNTMIQNSLPSTVSGNWTLSFKALHSAYQRGLWVAVYNESGTQGYGVFWDSSLQSYANGQGYVSIRKFTSAPSWDSAGSALTSPVASGHLAITGPMAKIELSRDAASNTLFLRVDGIPVAQVTDGSMEPFSRLVVRGNTSSYFDDVLLFTETPPSASQISNAVNVLSYGAVGDGITDNQIAITNAIAGAQSLGKALYIPPGVFRHSSTLNLNGISLFGSGYPSVLSASDPDHSNVQLDGSGASIRTCRFASPNATTRSQATATALINVNAARNFEISNCYMEQARTNGIIVNRVPSIGGLITGNWISDTLADGIHMTSGALSITVTHNRVRNSGDDMIAVVSYLGDGVLCSDILIADNDVRFQGATGRGIACIGGQDVSIQGNVIEATRGAGIMIASEGSYNTYAVDNVEVVDNVVINTSLSINQGAIHLNGRPGYAVSNVLVDGNVVRNANFWGVRTINDVHDSTISNNLIEETTAGGFDCQGSGRQNLTFQGNSLSNIGSYGFYGKADGAQGYLRILANNFTNIHTIGSETYVDVILLLAGSSLSSLNISDNNYTNPGGYLIERFCECHFPSAIVTGNTTDTGKPIWIGN